MPLNLPTFYKRTASAIVFAIIMLTGLLLGFWWKDYAFFLLIGLITLLCIQEYFKLVVTIFPLVIVQFLVAVLYILMPMMMLIYMRHADKQLPILLIVMIWINDTMAYLVGSFIGRTPFYPAISPKKTWEGTIGGIILTIATAAVWGYYSHHFRMQDWIMIALCASVAGTVGDLVESKLKRLAGVKDSGTLMPGHGGALDRFDSLLIATPFAFLYVYYFMPLP
jgi:phosphatidate cytidylyltransferase